MSRSDCSGKLHTIHPRRSSPPACPFGVLVAWSRSADMQFDSLLLESASSMLHLAGYRKGCLLPMTTDKIVVLRSQAAVIETVPVSMPSLFFATS